MTPKTYHFWITGCQMNYADARRVATELEKIGYRANPDIDSADVIILQTCTVRQQSEDKAYGKLHSLKPLKEQYPDKTIAVMGCVVGVRGNEKLEETFPYVDVFMEPSTDGQPLVAHLTQEEVLEIEATAVAQQHAWQDGEAILPTAEIGDTICAPVAIVYGCSHACTFCIIPQKRGKERSRAVGSIVAEVRGLVQQGVKEVMLLGQIVDRYGYDVPDGPDLADLLTAVNDVPGLERIRFLTSHPNYMTEKILYAVRDLPKVMPQIEVPIQAGNDEVLHNMKREYTQAEYRALIHKIRSIIPDASIHGDIIVGFPGETEAQFQETYDLLAELELDKIHLARYSPRPGTVSARKFADDVPDEEKRRRFHLIEELQKQISIKKLRPYLGTVQTVLVEEYQKGRWRGRNPQGRLVFFADPRELKGEVVQVKINHVGTWSISGEAVDRPTPVVPEIQIDTIPLAVL
jgi:tRNA-2-methylthio-N6-dimethylallyladenosine synthase